MDEAKLLREATSLVRDHVAKNLRHTPDAESRMYLPAGSAEILASLVIDLVRASDRAEDAERQTPFEALSAAGYRTGTVSLGGAEFSAGRGSSEPAFPRYGRNVRLTGSEPIPSDGEPGKGVGPDVQYPTNPCREIEGLRPSLPSGCQGLTIVPSPYGGIMFAGSNPDFVYGAHFLRSITFEDCKEATLVFKDGAVKWASLRGDKVVVEDATRPGPREEPLLPEGWREAPPSQHLRRKPEPDPESNDA